MKRLIAIALGGLMMVHANLAGEDGGAGASAAYPQLETYIDARIAEFGQIPADRKESLREVAQYVQGRAAKGEPVRLCFICTHNSRRSHMSQIWSATAAKHYGLASIHTYSGGTESTAFNPRAVAALTRAGFRIAKTTEDSNPVYHVRLGDGEHPMTCFSKVYDQAPNPKQDFCAVMTCSQADHACPVVRGAETRIAVTYEDPKVADGSKQEAAKYDERCRQIAREMLYVFSQVKRADSAR